MTKTAIVCTGPEPKHLFPTFIIGSAAAAMGDQVILFFTPAAAPALVRGYLEKVRAQGMPAQNARPARKAADRPSSSFTKKDSIIPVNPDTPAAR